MSEEQGAAAAQPGLRIRVLLAEDNALVRQGLAALLGLEPTLEVVGTVERGDEVVAMALEHSPDVVLMDVRMPGIDGIAATAALRAAAPRARVLFLSNHDDDAYVLDGLKAGALGYLLKDIEVKELVRAVRLVAGGETYMPPAIANKVLAQLQRAATAASPRPNELTARELDVLRLVAQGDSNREVGAKLFIGEATVKTHVSNILSKLELTDRGKAMIYAIQRGLVDLGAPI